MVIDLQNTKRENEDMARVVRIVNKEPDKKQKSVGLIAPHRGRVNEEEFPMVLPQEISTLITGLKIREATAEDLEKITTPPLIENAAKALASAGADIIIQCGTPVVFFKGPGFHKIIVERIEKASNVPAYTMAMAVVDALKRLGVKRESMYTFLSNQS